MVDAKAPSGSPRKVVPIPNSMTAVRSSLNRNLEEAYGPASKTCCQALVNYTDDKEAVKREVARTVGGEPVLYRFRTEFTIIFLILLIEGWKHSNTISLLNSNRPCSAPGKP